MVAVLAREMTKEPHLKKAPSFSNPHVVVLALLLLIGISIAWWFWPLLHAMRYSAIGWDVDLASQHGQFGDAFGAFTALFTGIAFVAVSITLYLQMLEMHRQQEEHPESKESQLQSERLELLFSLHQDFNSKEMLDSRTRADIIVQNNPDKTLAGLYESITLRERSDIWHVINFYQRLYLAIKIDRVDTQMVGELFGEVFYWWWIHSFERQVIPINRDSSRRIQDLKNWFDANCAPTEIERWKNRALLDFKTPRPNNPMHPSGGSAAS